jgi:hypothetical protein
MMTPTSTEPVALAELLLPPLLVTVVLVNSPVTREAFTRKLDRQRG